MRKLKALKIGGLQRQEKKKLFFVGWKAYFSSGYFITPFPLHFKDDF
jgi:hypothetical protein